MKLYIDADGCPVTRIAAERARAYGIPVTLVCDCAHLFEIEGTETVTVTKGADSADFRLVNLIRRGDIAVTQDYGLAAMCLARGAYVLDQNGREYTSENIDSLLAARHFAKKQRAAGARLKGPSKRTGSQDTAFLKALEDLFTRARSDR